MYALQAINYLVTNLLTMSSYATAERHCATGGGKWATLHTGIDVNEPFFVTPRPKLYSDDH